MDFEWFRKLVFVLKSDIVGFLGSCDNGFY